MSNIPQGLIIFSLLYWSTYNLKDLKDARKGFKVSNIDKEGGGSGGGDHPVYGDLCRHPAAGGGGDGATACLIGWREGVGSEWG